MKKHRKSNDSNSFRRKRTGESFGKKFNSEDSGRENSGFRRSRSTESSEGFRKENSGFRRPRPTEGSEDSGRENSGFRRSRSTEGSGSFRKENFGFRRPRPTEGSEDSGRENSGFRRSRSTEGSGSFRKENFGFRRPRPTEGSEDSGRENSGFRRSRSTEGSGFAKPYGFRNRRRPARPARPIFDPSEFVKKASTMTEAKIDIKHNFADFAIDERIKNNIAAKKYVVPTPIQDKIIPYILDQRDIVGAAATGTGKTAAFLIPLIHNVLSGKTEKVLIIAPTRELAEQIQDEFEGFKKGIPVYSALCIGGENIGFQIKQLSRNPQFVVGTPGRLADLKEREKIFFNQYDAIVLDEFDTMLSMGFINEIKEIMNELPENRQTIFFSATMPKKIERLVDSFLKDPIKISVISKPSAENVNQEIIKLNGRNKIDVLYELLTQKDFEKVLIFGGTKRETDKLSKTLAGKNLRVAAIHGNKSQDQRRRALNQFKSNKVKILLATDVLSRGLDIDNVSHVINYTLPQTYEDYIHRIGRTGRGSKTGIGLTLVD